MPQNPAHTELLPPIAQVVLPYILLGLAVFAAYSNIFDNQFVFDDDLIIVLNTWLQDWKHIPDILTGSTTGGVHIIGGFYRPVQILLYLFTYQIGDGSPFWFHLLNFSLHLANTCLVYKFGKKLGFDPKAVFFAALVWGLHPVHTEAVTYMSATADTLHVFFILWSLIVLLPDFSPRKILYVIPLFALGILSKETTVIFPALVVVCLFYLTHPRFKFGTYLRTWPLWVISLVYIAWRTTADGFDGPQTYARFYDVPSFSSLKIYAEQPLTRLYTFLSTLPKYLELLAWPTHLHMERYFPVQMSLEAPLVGLGLAILVLAAAHVAYSLNVNRWKELSFGLLWFAAAHAPDTGLLVPMNALFLEHWMYLPSIGLFLGIAQTARVGFAKHPLALPATAALAAIFAVSMATKTHLQNMIWRDPETFYTNIFSNGVSSARAHNNLALYYSKQGAIDKAIKEFEEAIATSDAYAETHFNLAIVYLNQNRGSENIKKAIAHLQRSIEIQPNFYRSYVALGDIHKQFLKDDDKAQYYYSRGKSLFETGR